ncbi:hypothetical protein [Halomonas sp. IOP_31]|uniref:hypothetical protein n=1 Tax=Halomonas sp. IOP_31 TaxID=2876584 RepID=UPI001E34C368|nr:hypothetical protein [Halomonas sp. IOP_31]MCD6006884.1 hypothetical protein [Halomonas sp. IOP_31]
MKWMFLLVGIGIGLTWGWIAAHHTVASECERLGGFFVGKKTFQCQQVQSKVGD